MTIWHPWPDEHGRRPGQGALYGLAIGDALGMPTQLMSHEEVAACFGVLDGFANRLLTT